MNKIEPTYLRYIYDGLNKGSINSQNASSLPNGFIGLFEEAFSSDKSVSERSSLLNRLGLWALFKGPVSCGFVCKILDEHEEKTKALVDEYSKWFNSPSPGKYVLYHDRLRTYLLQKLSDHESQALNEKIISHLEQAIKNGLQDEAEEYALEHLSTHMYVESQLDKNYERFHEYVNNEVLWPRQIQISKEYKWSQDGVQKSIKEAARRHDEMNTLKASVNSVKLNQDEQSSIKDIISFFENKEFYIAVERIKRLKIETRFKVSIFFIYELILGSFNKCDEAKDVSDLLIDNLKNSEDTNFSWASDFPIIMMYKVHLNLKKIGINDDVLWKNNNLIYELIDFELIKKRTIAFNKKILNLEKNGFLGEDCKNIALDEEIEVSFDDETQKFKTHYIFAYLNSVKYVLEDEIDLNNVINLWTKSEYTNSDELIKILEFHFTRSNKLPKKQLQKVQKNQKIYYRLPGDEIISTILNNGIDAFVFHSILHKNSLIRHKKYRVNCEFYEDEENKLSIIKSCIKEDNIFKTLSAFSEILDKVLFNEDEKLIVMNESEFALSNSNIHPAHVATAYVYISDIYRKTNNINKSIDYLNQALLNKQKLYDDNKSNESLKENVGNLYIIIYYACLICSESSLDKIKRASVFKIIENLLNLSIDIEYDKSDLLCYKSKTPNQKIEEGFISEKYNVGFNRLLNLVLLSFSKNENCKTYEMLFLSIKELFNNLKLDYLWKIDRRSVDYLEKYFSTDLAKVNFGVEYKEHLILNNHSTQFGVEAAKREGKIGHLFIDWDNFEGQIPAYDKYLNRNIETSDNLISNLFLFQQKLVFLFTEKNLFDEAEFYFNEFSKNYHFKNFDPLSLQQTFKNLFFLFIKSLLKCIVNLNGTNTNRKSNFLNTVIDKIPQSKFHEFIFDTDLLTKIIRVFDVNIMVKNIFRGLNISVENSNSLSWLYQIIKNLIKIDIDNAQNIECSFDLDPLIKKSVLIVSKRHFDLVEKNVFENKESSGYETLLHHSKLEEFKMLVIKLNELDNTKALKYFNKYLLNLLHDISIGKFKNNVKPFGSLGDDSSRLAFAKEALSLMEFSNQKASYTKGLKKLVQTYDLNISSLFREDVKKSYKNAIEFLTRGYLLYNPIEKKYENPQMYEIEDEFDSGDISIVLSNLSFLSQEEIDFIEKLYPWDGMEKDYLDYNDYLMDFDKALLLIRMEKYDDGVDVLNNIPDYISKFKSLAYYYSVMILLKKKKYRLARKVCKKISYAYFDALSAFEFFKYYRSINNQSKLKIAYDAFIKKALKLELNFEKSDVFYEAYKYQRLQGDVESFSFLKNKITELCYVMCLKVFECEMLFKTGNASQARKNFNKIFSKYKKDKSYVIEYSSKLEKKLESLSRLINEGSKKIVEDTSETIIDFNECNFEYMDYMGCGEERDEVIKLGKLSEKEKLMQMAESIKFARFKSSDHEMTYAKIMQTEIYIQLGDYEKAYQCLP